MREILSRNLRLWQPKINPPRQSYEKRRRRSKMFVEKFFKKNLENIDSPVYSHLLRWQNTAQIQHFFSDEYRSKMPGIGDFIERHTATLPDGYMSWHPLSRAQYNEISLFLSKTTSKYIYIFLADIAVGSALYALSRIWNTCSRETPFLSRNDAQSL